MHRERLHGLALGRLSAGADLLSPPGTATRGPPSDQIKEFDGVVNWMRPVHDGGR